MSQENIVEKSTSKKVIALAVICIILAASLVGVIVFYTLNQGQSNAEEIESLQAQIAEKENMIAALTTQIASLQNQINFNNDSVAQLNQALIQMEANYQQLLQIVRLEASGVLVNQQSVTQNANTYTTIWDNILEYAGYVTLEVTATSNTTYVETLYNSFESNFVYNVTIGQSGTAVFPILPGPVTIRIGNTEQVNVNNATVNVFYYY